MKHTLAFLCVLPFLLLCAGCGHTMAPPALAPPPPESILESSNQDSLFKGDQAVLSDQDIARILGTHIDLHERHRLAILNLGPQSWWSDELAEVEARKHPSKPKSGFLGTPAQLQRPAGRVQGVATIY